MNRPFVVDYEEGKVGEYENDDVNDGDNLDDILDAEEGVTDEETDNNPKENVPRILRVTVQYFGSGIPLPFFRANQPNHDYYASNITLHNMNFVDCASGQCFYFLLR
jgi:hypothetical protein